MKNKKHSILITLAVICFLLFFIGGPGYHASRSFKHIWDTGHILFFAIFTYLLLLYWKWLQDKPFLIKSGWILLITLVLGGGVEIIQLILNTHIGLYRFAGMGDLLRDFLGSLLTLVIIFPSQKNIHRYLILTFQIVTVTLLTISFFPLAIALTDEYNARKKFPILSGFETLKELKRWEGNADIKLNAETVLQGNYSLEVSFKTTTYSGVSLKYFPGNWSSYDSLEFHINNPGNTPIRIICRIHDKEHTEGEQHYEGRFNKSFIISGGWNRIKINLQDVKAAPKGRDMDMEQIYGMSIFVARLEEQRTIYLDDVRLGN